MTFQAFPLLRYPAAARLALFVATGTALLLPAPAQAKSCCQLPACIASSFVSSTLADKTVGRVISNFEDYIIDKLTTIRSTYLPLLANDTANVAQAQNNTRVALVDAEKAADNGAKIAETRMELIKAVTPSQTTCATSSRNEAITGAMMSATRRTAYNKSGLATSGTMMNAPGSEAEKGALASESGLFKRLMTGFCSSADLNLPAGVPCTLENGMVHAYLQPFRVLFGVPNNLIPPDPKDVNNRAARLFTELAGSSVVPDPVRGPALAGSTGQTSYIHLSSDAAAYSLAKGALDRMVDERIGTTTPGSESVEYLRQKAWDNAADTISGGKVVNEFVEHTINRSGNTEEMNDSDISQLVQDVNTIYLQLYVNLERLAIIKATRVARMVKQSSAVSAQSVALPASFKKE